MNKKYDSVIDATKILIASCYLIKSLEYKCECKIVDRVKCLKCDHVACNHNPIGQGLIEGILKLDRALK